MTLVGWGSLKGVRYMTPSNVLEPLKYVFTSVGLIALIIAAMTFYHTQRFLHNAVRADGIVTDINLSRSKNSNMIRPSVQFMAGNGELTAFTARFSSSSPRYSIGDVVDVLYEESMPKAAKIDSFVSLWAITLIVAAVGLMFFLAGLVITVILGAMRRKIKWLEQYGVNVIAEFQGVERNRWMKINARHPYQILAQWQSPFTLKYYVFRSENLNFDPSDHLSSKQLNVLIDQRNPKNYHFDTGFLSKNR